MTIRYDHEQHRYWLGERELPSVTRIMTPLYAGAFDSIAPEVLEEARQRGTDVHEITAARDMGYNYPAERDDLDGYLSAWESFLFQANVTIVRTEHIVYNAELGYAGRLDRVALIDGYPAILDLKTTATIDPAVGVQLAAYEKACGRYGTDRQSLKRFAVQLRLDGTYRLQEFRDPADWRCFLALLNVYQWREKNR